MAPSSSSSEDITYYGILRNGVPSILNNAAAPTALLLNLALFSRAGGQEWMAAWAVVQSTTSFAQGMFNFLLYVPMAQIAHAVGQKQCVQRRVAYALLAGIVLGITCTICLCASLLDLQGWACLFKNKKDCSENQDGLVLDWMNVTASVRPLAIYYLLGRVPSILLVFVNRVCTGILVGKQRIRLVTCINVGINVLDVTGNATVLLLFKGSIYQAGLATSGATVLGIFLILPLSIYLKAPKEKDDDDNDHLTTVTPRIDEEEHYFSVLDFVSSSLNMIARSILLQGAVYTLSILASRIGTSELAAHQVILQIWSLVSFCCDGFADVGTMVGARLLGEGQDQQLVILTQRLLVFAVVAGALCGSILLVFQDSIIDLFTTNEEIDTQTALRSVWLLTALMQPINALVFVSDGLLFAHQAFSFIRNLMLIGVLGIFLPSLIIGYSKSHTLLSLWIAKSALSSWRCLAAFWFCGRYQREHSGSSIAAESSDQEDGVATEASALLA